MQFNFFESSYNTYTGDIADTLLNDLLDLKKVFARINTNKLSPLIVPSLCREINAIVKKEGNR